MSEYYDFDRCVVCRSKYNLENYIGDFEVTMLINSLYLTVMYLIENRNELHIKSKKIEKWLRENIRIDGCGNEFNSDELVRCLRNGLAHFNIMVESNNEKISLININAKNVLYKSCFNYSCENSNITNKNYLESDGYILRFFFTVQQLKKFTQFIVDIALDVMKNDKCELCKYREILKTSRCEL